MTYNKDSKVKLGLLVAGVSVVALVVFASMKISPIASIPNYPASHAKVDYDGKCYILSGPAEEAYQRLSKEWQLLAMKLALQDIEDPNTKIRIEFFGTRADVQNFIDKYGIENVVALKDPDYSDGKVVSGLITKSKLEGIVNNLTAERMTGSSISVESSVLINDPAIKGITEQETQARISNLESFWNNGVKQIIDTKVGVMGCG